MRKIYCMRNNNVIFELFLFTSTAYKNTIAHLNNILQIQNNQWKKKRSLRFIRDFSKTNRHDAVLLGCVWIPHTAEALTD